MKNKLWLIIVIILLAAAALFAFAATGHTYFAAVLALIAVLIVIYRFAGRVLRIVVTVLLVIGVVVFAIIEVPIVKAARTDAPDDCDYIIVLGAGLHGDVPSLSLRNRLDAALEWLEAHPDCVAVVSGGQGPDEPTTEAQAMYDYLVEYGVEPERIWQEDQSHNTWQNVRYTLALLEEKGADTSAGVVLVSSGFHLTRARMLWERASGGAGELSTLAAPCTHVPSRLKMYIREPFALVKSFLFDR